MSQYEPIDFEKLTKGIGLRASTICGERLEDHESGPSSNVILFRSIRKHEKRRARASSSPSPAQSDLLPYLPGDWADR